MMPTAQTNAAAHRPARPTSHPGAHRPARQTPSHPSFAPTDSVHVAAPEAVAKAALSPLLEPAVQFALVTGFMLAAANAQGSAVPLVTVDAALKAMGNASSTTYTIDLKNDAKPVATDAYGEKANGELTAAARGPMTFSSPDGTKLTLSENQKTKAIHLDGTLAGLDAHLTLASNPPAVKDDDLQGFHMEGTIGGQAYTLDSTFNIDQATKQKPSEGDDKSDELPPPETGTFHARGSAAGQPIQKDYKFSESQEPYGARIALAGTGHVAGVQQDAQVVLTMVA